MQVLIVEDEPNYSDTLEMFVEELGYEVLGVCASGKDALEVFHETKPDLVLMDIHLEGELSGIDLARIFQGHGPMPIIFISTWAALKRVVKTKP